jgi:hypothetical protein
MLVKTRLWPVSFVLAVAVTALVGCGSEKKPKAASGSAYGEVLPGSASDAMIPYDSVRSQPPLASGGGEPDERSAESKPKQRRAAPEAAVTPDGSDANDAPEQVPDSPTPIDE